LPDSKHSPAPISPARLVFLAAVTVLVALVVWVAVRAVGPSSDQAAGPTVVLPSVAPTVPVGAAEPESPSPTISLLPASSPSSASPSRSRSASPKHSAPASTSPTPKVSRTPSAPPVAKATFTATLSTSSSWGGGYVGMVKITNTGTKAATWSMTVSHPSVSGLRLFTTWNAQGSQQGSTFSFSGPSLAPGQSASFGYEAGARTRDKLRPSGCSVASGSCHVS
jgi:hypothetical protein